MPFLNVNVSFARHVYIGFSLEAPRLWSEARARDSKTAVAATVKDENGSWKGLVAVCPKACSVISKKRKAKRQNRERNDTHHEMRNCTRLNNEDMNLHRTCDFGSYMSKRMLYEIPQKLLFIWRVESKIQRYSLFSVVYRNRCGRRKEKENAHLREIWQGKVGLSSFDTQKDATFRVSWCFFFRVLIRLGQNIRPWELESKAQLFLLSN